METFRGEVLILPRSKDWKSIDETDNFSKKQRLKCKEKYGRECTLYPFPAGMQVLDIFKPRRWLDPTAGWGDRLRCAIKYGCVYTGVDSNKSMQSAYKEIIQHYIPQLFTKYRKNYKVIYGRFQDTMIEGKYDLVFTSPPFFNKEIYEGMVEWKNVEHFFEEFLKPLICKSFKHLEKDGHIVLYIEDMPEEEFIDMMKLFVKDEIPELTYEGAFYYQGAKPRPYYVWKY